MPNLQLTLTTTREQAELYSDTLSDAGALAVTFLDGQQEPLFEPELGTTPLWTCTQVIGLFEQETDTIALKSFIQAQLGETALQTLVINTVADQDWEKACRDQFQPMQFGNHLWICPSWANTPPTLVPDPKAHTILLDPGLAFGTGTHPTTRLCLEWLDKHPPIEKNVVDYGCGSGILGIAALKLGATQVYAVDYDPQALQSTHDNAQKNNYFPKQMLALLPEDFNAHALSWAKRPAIDLIVANILLNPLIRLAPEFAAWLKPSAPLVLSGILDTQLDLLLNTYNTWFENSRITQLNEWCRVDLTKRN
jgi:ribosomal protein L11 methyltransferase